VKRLRDLLRSPELSGLYQFFAKHIFTQRADWFCGSVHRYHGD
jgi:hypothetical protein